MKKMFIGFLMIVLCGVLISAENLKFSRLSLSAGEGAFTSGFDSIVFLENSNSALEIAGSNTRSYITYFRKVSPKLMIGPYLGIFKNMVHGGFYTILNLKLVSFFYWQGWGMGEPGMPNWKLHPFFQNMGASVNPLGGFRVSYVYCKFSGERFHIPGMSYSLQINEKISFLVGCDYKIAYGQKNGKSLYRMGVIYQG